MMKSISTYITIVILCLLFSFPARTEGFNFRIASGPTLVVVGKTRTLDNRATIQIIPLILDIGYKINDRFAIWADGQYWWPGFHFLGFRSFSVSLLGGYYFPAGKDPIAQPYVLLGLGYGTIMFIRDYDYGTLAFNGLFQLQVGGGVEFRIAECFNLGVETRARFGFPHYPDVVGISLLGVASFTP